MTIKVIEDRKRGRGGEANGECHLGGKRQVLGAVPPVQVLAVRT
jgi:hypothetical protein